MSNIEAIKEVLLSYGYWAHGADLEHVAREWVAEGFTACEADAWLDAEVCWACDAKEYKDKGLSPDNWKEKGETR